MKYFNIFRKKMTLEYKERKKFKMKMLLREPWMNKILS